MKDKIAQISFLTDCIEDYIREDNPVRVIDAFVESLDLVKAGFSRSIPNETGRPSYDPKDLLKLYVYGYFNKIRSSRKLMVECTRNVELFYLLKKLTPDFRTIADFRKDNAKSIKSVFRAFVNLCMKLDLYQKDFWPSTALKCKEKATAELGLSFLAYNMKRAINMVGVKSLISTI